MRFVFPFRLAMLFLVSASACFAETVRVADFEKGTDGFSGNIESAPSQGYEGGRAGVIQSVPGEPWVETSRPVDWPYRIEALRFRARSGEARGLAVRIVDGTGQSHQARVPLKPDGQWQEVVVDSFARGAGLESWGGAGDKVVHWPAKTLTFIVETGALGPAGGAVYLDDVEAVLSAERFVSLLRLRQAQLGNIFSTAEPVTISVETQAEEVAWSATNYWKEPVASGVMKTKDAIAEIRPELGGKGYFELKLVARTGGQPIAEATTCVAVIAPADIAKMPGSPFGVMTHFAQGWDTDIMPLIAKAGIGIIRDELYWKTVEKVKGRYDFSGRYEDYMAAARENGLRTLIVMSFENPLHDNGLTPHTDAGRLAYAKYGEAILDRFGEQTSWIEVWNEYNGTWCEGPAREDRPRYYTEMLRTVHEVLKASHPDVQILGGAAVLLPPPYFEGIFKCGGLEYMDGIVIHPYRGSPEGVDEEIEELKALMRRYGAEKPIWVTETGSWDKGPGGRTQVAAYLAKIYTLLLTQTQSPICWYLIRDYADFHSMGLLRDGQAPEGRYAPAPAYVAYANLIQQLYGAKFAEREKSAGRSRVYLFRKGEEEVRCCWATSPVHVSFEAEGTLELIDLMGVRRELTPRDGRVYLTLSETPVFLRGLATPALDAPRFVVAPIQRAEVGAPVQVRFTLNNEDADKACQGIVRMADTKGSATARAGEKVTGEILIEAAGNKPERKRLRYEAELDGKLCAAGDIEVDRCDPGALTGASAGYQPGNDVLADSDEEFSSTQGKNGWSYGSCLATAGEEEGGSQGENGFRPLSHEQTMWGYEWKPAVPNGKIDRKTAHPAADAGRPIWMVRRWASSVEGPLRFTGRVLRESPEGDGTGVKVLVDGQVVYSGLAGGADGKPEVDFEVYVPVRKGALIDFAITPGPGTNIDFDAVRTVFRVGTAEPILQSSSRKNPMP